MDGSVMSIRMF